jgi:hypothetical protein
VAGSQVAACPTREMRREGQGSPRRYASFEDIRTKFIAAIKHSPPASCRAQSEGKHAGRRKSIRIRKEA